MKNPVSKVVAVFLFIVAALHLLRLVLQVEVTVGGTLIPLWASIVGCLVSAALGLMLAHECSR